MVRCILALYVALLLAKAYLTISCRWYRMGPCLSGLLDGSGLVVILSGWCVGVGVLGVVWFNRVKGVGLLVVMTLSGVVGVGLVGFVDGRM